MVTQIISVICLKVGTEIAVFPQGDGGPQKSWGGGLALQLACRSLPETPGSFWISLQSHVETD